MRVKICGITSLEDALQAIEAGADALGFVFYPPSPRYVSPAQAAKIIAQLPPLVSTVGLVVNLPSVEVKALIKQTKIDIVQFHGDESAIECESIEYPYLRALRMQPGVDIASLAAEYTQARAILLDAWVAGVPGGTGRIFNWQEIPQLTKPLILAGGLTVTNIEQAVKQVQPYAVDVSGGVELRHGVKDANKVAEFIRLAKQSLS